MQSYDYIILGAGISGITFARLLQQHTDKKFIVLEKENEPGGLCRTHHLGSNDFDIGGGHFLYSRYREVYDFIFDHIPQSEFNKFNRNTKIRIHNQYIDYPIEQNLWQLPGDLLYPYMESLYDSAQVLSKPVGFRQWVYKNLGRAIADNYMIPYNQKMWGVDLDSLSLDWLYKIPVANVKEILGAVTRGRPGGYLPTHEYFYYPKRGGFQSIVNAIYEPVKDHVRLGELVTEVVDIKGRWFVNGKYSAATVINTIPWTALSTSLTHPMISGLKHTGLVVSFVRVPPEIQSTVNMDHQWCYVPDMQYAHHRVFNINTYATGNKDVFIASETNVKRWKHDESHAYHYRNEYAYPIPTTYLKSDMQDILSFYARKNLHGLGRWGQWRHHNSDMCILEAMTLFNALHKT